MKHVFSRLQRLVDLSFLPRGFADTLEVPHMSETTEEKEFAPESAHASADAPKEPVENPAEAAPPPDPLVEATASAAKFKDQALRAMADLDNFRKRSRKEVEDARKSGKEDFLKEFLPVFDNLERAMQSAKSASDLKPVVDGLDMIGRQFADTLERAGMKRVPGVGAMFDPLMHEAISQVETDEHPPGMVITEVQPGYLNGERLVRAAMVVVAKPKAS
jgi:molecular chaperone GrpE